MREYRELLATLGWSQLVDIIRELEIDETLFSQNWSPADLALTFEKQVKLIASARELDSEATKLLVKEAFTKILGITPDIDNVKQGSIKAREGLSEVVSLLSNTTTRSSIVNALAPAKNSLIGLSSGITTMWRGKEAHEALHNLALMTPELLKAARQWLAVEADSPDKGPRMLDLRRLSTGVSHNIRKFEDTVKLLPAPWDTIFGNTADFLEMAIEEVKSASADLQNGDPETPILSIIQPNIRQKPSEIQNLIAQQASSLPFDEVITAFTICDFATKDDTLEALSSLRDGTAAIERQHHAWQHIDNQIRAMEIPIENLEKSPANARQAALILKFLRSQLDEVCSSQDQDGINQNILQLADSVATKLATPDAEPWDLRADFLDFHGHISQRFYATDASLLNACRDMEPLCDPLLHLVNAL